MKSAAHIGLQELFLEIRRPIEFHQEHASDDTTEIGLYCLCHMSKISSMPC